jgi:hypothetical protein
MQGLLSLATKELENLGYKELSHDPLTDAEANRQSAPLGHSVLFDTSANLPTIFMVSTLGQTTPLLQATTQAEERYRIAMILMLAGIVYHDVVKRGLDGADKKLPYVEIILTDPSQNHMEKQIETIEKLPPTKPDLIVIAGWSCLS